MGIEKVVSFTPSILVAVADVQHGSWRLDCFDVQTMQTRKVDRHDDNYHDLPLACDSDASARGELVIA